MTAPLITIKLSQLRGDVVLTSLADGDVLTYDSGAAKWKNVAPSGGGGGSVDGTAINPASTGLTTPGPAAFFSGTSAPSLLLTSNAVGFTDGSHAILLVKNYQDAVVFAVSEGGVSIGGTSPLAVPGLQITGSVGILRNSYGVIPIINSALQWPSNVQDVQLDSVATGVLRLSANGSGGAVLQIGAVSSLGTPDSGCVRIGNISGEVNVCDSSGNVTVISPHAKDAPSELYEVGPGADHMDKRVNVFLATVEWTARDREKCLLKNLLLALTSTENSGSAWADTLQRLQNGRAHCYATETFAEYEQRTGNSLVPEGQDHDWWLTVTPAERWQKVKADRVAAAQAAHDAWSARKDAFIATPDQQTFPEPEPALYTAQPVPDFLA